MTHMKTERPRKDQPSGRNRTSAILGWTAAAFVGGLSIAAFSIERGYAIAGLVIAVVLAVIGFVNWRQKKEAKPGDWLEYLLAGVPGTIISLVFVSNLSQAGLAIASLITGLLAARTVAVARAQRKR